MDDIRIGTLVKIVRPSDDSWSEYKVGDLGMVTELDDDEEAFGIYFPKYDNYYAWFDFDDVEVVKDLLEEYR